MFVVVLIVYGTEVIILLNRLKAVRKYTGLTQMKFAKKIGMSQSGYGQIETGDRGISDRLIKAVCMAFNIDEHWLRTGEGNMLSQTEESMLEQLAEEYKLTAAEKEVVKYFLELNADERAEILDHMVNIAEVIKKAYSSKPKRPDKPDDELTRAEVHQMIDQELDDREKGITSTVSTGTNGLKRNKP